MSKKEPAIIDPLDDATEIIPFTYSIASYGADYPVDSLVKRIREKDIVVPTFEHQDQLQENIDAFQREYVWPKPKADRFIESLLLGLPIPGIFLVKEVSGRLLVLDGHQRLYTLRAFYEGTIQGQEYTLAGIQERFIGKTYKTLELEDRRRLDDSIIHATIIRQETPSDDWSSIYVIFERLNTGGITLQAQEIRMALYHGKLAGYLRKANLNPQWRKLIGPPSKRLKDIELILRFFALVEYHTDYQSPMKNFLNRYMSSKRNLDAATVEHLDELFTATTTAIYDALGNNAFKPDRVINAAFTDALMVGVGTSIKRGKTPTKRKIESAKNKLLQDEDFIAAITTGTSQEPKVTLRIQKAIKALS